MSNAEENKALFLLNESVNEAMVLECIRLSGLSKEEWDKRSKLREDYARYKYQLNYLVHNEIKKRCKWSLSEYGYLEAQRDIKEELGIKILSFDEWSLINEGI